MKQTWRPLFLVLFGSLLLGTASCSDGGGASSTGGGASATSSSGGGGTAGVAGAGGAGGAGGTGGFASTGGAGGTGGSTCDPAACPPPSNECVDAICDGDGQCAEQPKADGTIAATQPAGDCKTAVCQGGALATQDDNTDAPDDANDCTDDVCTDGVPGNPVKAVDSPCGLGGTSFCDGSGTCSECTTPAQCLGEDTECQSRTCDAGVCGLSNTAQDTPTSSQTMGDCKVSQCDGAGAIEIVADTDDIEDDGNACTEDACDGSEPVHPPTAIHTVCGAGLQCDGAGTCVGCITAADCDTPGNACLVATCVTGVCGTASVADGSTCDDGNACTQVDTCQGGACTGASPVLCTSLDSCHDAGTCDTETGICSNPNKVNGTACNDGNACTQTDTCQAGTCTGASPVTCAALDSCHNAGTCNTATGVCSNPNKANGTACNDGNACTQTDTCQAGTCTGASPVICSALDQCHDAGTCNTATGVCSNINKADGTACTVNAQSGTCGGGVCAVCGNGTTEGTEACDDGNATPCDGCSPKCQLDTSITYASAAGLARTITDDGYNGTTASMACVNVTVISSGDGIVDYVCPTVGLAHTWVGDLTIKLISPASTSITLMSMPGVVEAADNGTNVTGDSSNLLATFPVTWKDAGPKSAENMGNTLANSGVVCKDDAACIYDPNNGAAAAGKLAAFIGQAGPGTWKLCVGDSGIGDIGTIDQVKLVIGQ